MTLKKICALHSCATLTPAVRRPRYPAAIQSAHNPLLSFWGVACFPSCCYCCASSNRRSRSSDCRVCSSNFTESCRHCAATGIARASSFCIIARHNHALRFHWSRTAAFQYPHQLRNSNASTPTNAYTPYRMACING
jgi:hypothetical protein